MMTYIPEGKPHDTLLKHDDPIESTIPLDKVEPGKGIPRKTYFTLVSLRKPTELPPLEAKPSNDDILNAILPPREWIENSCLLINFRYSLYTIRIT